MEFKIQPASLSKELILDYVPEESIMEHYLGLPVKKGLFKSPLRSDSNPTCSFYRNRNGSLIFKDFSGDFYGNVFDVVMRIYNVNYHKALKIIANDFGIKDSLEIPKNPKLIEYTNNKFNKSNITEIQIEMKEYSDKELEYWENFGITLKTLKFYNVYSCKHVFLNGSLLTSSSDTDFVFGYYRLDESDIDYFRIYFPNRTRYRFLSNWKSNMLQGSQQLPNYNNILVITKSLKDVMCLYELGITAIAPNSETMFMNINQYENLKTRFNRIYLFFDNDLPGISNMNRIKKRFSDIKCIWIPRKYGVKDITDFYKKYGKEDTVNIINTIRNE